MRYLKFNGIEFSQKSNYLLSQFEPNDVTVHRQEDIPVGRSGAKISNAYYNSRIVNVVGNIIACCRADLFEKMQYLSARCNGVTQGDLLYHNGTKLYKASAIADSPQYGQIRCGRNVEFNINFTLPDFFWLSNDEVVTDVSMTDYFSDYSSTVYVGKSFDVKPDIYLYPQRTAAMIMMMFNKYNKTKVSWEIPVSDQAEGDMYIISTQDETMYRLRGSVKTDVSSYLTACDFKLSQLAHNDLIVNTSPSTYKTKMQLKYHYRYIGV